MKKTLFFKALLTLTLYSFIIIIDGPLLSATDTNVLTISNIFTSNISTTGFDISIQVSGDINNNSTAILYYCNKTNSPECNPESGESINMIRNGNMYKVSVTGLSASCDIGDELSLRVIATDIDGVNNSPINSTVILNVCTALNAPKIVTPSFPGYDKWLSNMLEMGEKICSKFVVPAHSSDSYYTRRDSVYYDGARSYWQMVDFLSELSIDVSRWEECANYANDNYAFYLEARLSNNAYNVPGYWRFPHGLYMTWLKTGDPVYITHLERLRNQNPFYDPMDGAPGWYYQKYSREVAYSIQAHIWAQKAGVVPNNKALNTLVDIALAHLEIWHTGKFRDPDNSQHFRQSFMVGLTMAALIEYYEEINKDTRIPTLIKASIDDLWEQMWVPDASNPGLGQTYPQFKPGYGSFWNWANWTGTEYDIDETHWGTAPNVAPDLNMLIASAYAWIYKETGDITYLSRGDLVFEGGAENAWLEYAKNFNQSYRWSFDYVKWRKMGHK